MQKALVVKELRESAGIVALAAVAAAYVLADMTATALLPWQSDHLRTYPFVYDSLSFYFPVVMGGLAVALALKQTVWEQVQGTFHFLLHRPMNRNDIFRCKLVIGSALVMSLAGLLILAYALWAATPGHMEAPFFWSMTISAWQMWIALPPVYLGAFLVGMRPGRWVGSRLVPLVAGILMAIVAASVPWFWLSALISLATSAALVVSILLYVDVRDY